MPSAASGLWQRRHYDASRRITGREAPAAVHFMREDIKRFVTIGEAAG